MLTAPTSSPPAEKPIDIVRPIGVGTLAVIPTLPEQFTVKRSSSKQYSPSLTSLSRITTLTPTPNPSFTFEESFVSFLFALSDLVSVTSLASSATFSSVAFFSSSVGSSPFFFLSFAFILSFIVPASLSSLFSDVSAPAL